MDGAWEITSSEIFIPTEQSEDVGQFLKESTFFFKKIEICCDIPLTHANNRVYICLLLHGNEYLISNATRRKIYHFLRGLQKFNT